MSAEGGTHNLPGLSDHEQGLLGALVEPQYAKSTQRHYELTVPIKQFQGRARLNDIQIEKGIPLLDGPSDPPPLPHQPAKPSPLKNTFGDIPESLLSSKHAPSANELASPVDPKVSPKTPSPKSLRVYSCDTPGSPGPSPDSTTSTGEWRRPVTRFQHLAPFIKPGKGLNETEAAALELWTEASKEQLQWNKLMARCQEMTKELHAMLSEESDDISDFDEVSTKEAQEEENGYEDPSGFKQAQKTSDGPFRKDSVVEASGEEEKQPVISDEDDEDEEGQIEILEAKAGLSKRWCRGKNLTEVLAEVRSRE